MKRKRNPTTSASSTTDQSVLPVQSPYRQPLLVLCLVALAVALLLFRVLYVERAEWSWLRIARIAFPSLLFVGACLTFIGRLSLRQGRRTLSFFSSTRLRAGLVLAWTTLATLADLAAGQSGVLYVFGVGGASVIAWKDRRHLAIGLALSAICTAAGSYALSGALDIELIAFIVGAAVLGAVVARTVQLNVAPNEERLQYLERENKELWDLSFRDTLTGLYNRRFAQETGQKLLNRAVRYHEHFHALMLDIDHFKRVNDKVSHAAGDDVLKEIAVIIQDCVRSSDVVARYGGEEFVVLLLQADPELAQNIANRIRDDVASHRIRVVPWQITISIGVASVRAGDGLDDILDRADKYLYVSKRAGRNRVSGS